MKGGAEPLSEPRFRLALLATVVVIQAGAAVFFIADAAVDLGSGDWGVHIIIEVVIAFALMAGVILGAWQTALAIERVSKTEESLCVARGAVADLLDVRFDQWGLTAAESDVALFALKGCEVQEISRMRQVAEGTVRAQLTSVYAKAGVSSRAGLMSLFFDDLIEQGHARRNSG